MATLLYTDARFGEHDTSDGHPERPERMDAVARGVATSVVTDDLLRLAPRPATVDELARVHERSYLDALERFCASGGGHLDPDTVVVPTSWEAALRAAGAGPAAVAEMAASGEPTVAFLALRPPGHHAGLHRAE